MGYNKVLEMFYNYNVTADIAMEDLANLAVKYAILRCKNCKLYEPSLNGKEFGWCNYFDSRVAEDHYCSYGEEYTTHDSYCPYCGTMMFEDEDDER